MSQKTYTLKPFGRATTSPGSYNVNFDGTVYTIPTHQMTHTKVVRLGTFTVTILVQPKPTT